MTYSCTDEYDDTLVWEEINNLKTSVEKLNSDITSIQTILAKVQSGKYVVDYAKTENGCTLTFNDGSTVSVENGKDGEDGKNAAYLSIELGEDGQYYWTVTSPDGTTAKLKYPDTDKDVPVGTKIEVKNGYLMVDGQYVKDSSGNFVEFKNPIIKSVTDNGDYITIMLQDYSYYNIPKYGTVNLAFSSKSVFSKETTLTIPYTSQGIGFVEVYSKPGGWTVSVNEEKSELNVTVPTAEAEGRIVIIGASEKTGQTFMAAIEITIGTLPAGGFYIYNEGWYGHEPASLNYYCNNTLFERIFASFNPGKKLGNTGTSLVKNGNKYYLVCKDAPNIIETNSEWVWQSEMSRASGQVFDFDAFDATTGYYMSADGLYKVAINPLSSEGEKIYSAANNGGCDVHCSNGKVFFIQSKKLFAYNPASGETKELEAPAVTGFKETSDGSLWAASTSDIVKINTNDLSVTKISLGEKTLVYNTMAYTPCAIDIAPDGKTIYFGTDDNWGVAKSVSKLDLESGTVTKLYDLAANGYSTYGSAINVNPSDGNIYISNNSGWDYTTMQITVIKPDGTLIENINYGGAGIYWFPSKIYFF